jgi:hypothetical protein
MLMRR